MASLTRSDVPERYRRTAKMVGLTLMRGPDAQAWHGLTVVLAARLNNEERTALAWAVLRSLDPLTAGRAFDTAIPQAAGAPLPTLESAMADATWWASRAGRDELKAYAAATFNHLSMIDRAAFLEWANGSERRAA